MHDLAPSPPTRPVVAVLAVVIREGAVLLVQRANPPDAGLWGFPGGKVDLGETLLAAAARELFEETGVTAVADGVITALDAHDRTDTGVLRHHFVLVAVRCVWQHGTPLAADDALDAKWVEIKDMEATLVLSRDVAAVARQAAAMA
ncbi:NUDIX hydrolase [Roseicitreum antarcticum]|uniref:ADP-ribose pyrophosphatase YjhB, NUDIX family n=1 Tax=Roseicitreum antarcticum TaxID=564137 RepID=A0A1H2SFZ3_9RHOB|nr:NUDIX hydrolase [Roseicitreum antarcticum]SDW30551.1 ADP-ribose pyrophosphatase YjhB, NUDIX family [Roseicitreum antarcticum]